MEMEAKQLLCVEAQFAKGPAVVSTDAFIGTVAGNYVVKDNGHHIFDGLLCFPLGRTISRIVYCTESFGFHLPDKGYRARVFCLSFSLSFTDGKFGFASYWCGQNLHSASAC